MIAVACEITHNGTFSQYFSSIYFANNLIVAVELHCCVALNDSWICTPAVYFTYFLPEKTHFSILAVLNHAMTKTATNVSKHVEAPFVPVKKRPGNQLRPGVRRRENEHKAGRAITGKASVMGRYNVLVYFIRLLSDILISNCNNSTP